VTVAQPGLAGLNVTRRVFVAELGYSARFIEFLANPTSEPITVDLELRTILNQVDRQAGVRATSSGRDVPMAGGGNPGRRAVLAAGNSGQSSVPYLAMVWDGIGASRSATEVSYGQGAFTVRWANVTIPANGQTAFMHFVSQAGDLNGARAAAERLNALPPEAL